jgi:hypothetical protein
MAAEKFKVKYILEGHSFRTEGITPPGWYYFDAKYVDDINKKFGDTEMKTFPNLWLWKWMKWMILGIKRVRPLYYVDYQKEAVKKFLHEEFDWNWYSGHHMENSHCAFSHYLLTYKFHTDLRLVELSALIRSGQMTKAEAIIEMGKPPYFPPGIVEDIKKEYRLTDAEYDEIYNRPPKSYKDYKTYLPTFRLLRPLFWVLYKTDRVTKSFYLKYCFGE